MTKNKLQEISFQMISKIGKPKLMAINAFKEYKKNKNKDKLLKKLSEAEKELWNVGKLHLDILQSESQGNQLAFSIMLVHAEDQYMSTVNMIEILKLIA